MKRIPSQAGNAGGKEKQPRAVAQSYDLNPSWRIGHFDINGKWGLESLAGPIVFNYSESIISLVLETGDNALNDVLTELDRRSFNCVERFWQQLSSRVSVPSNIIGAISSVLVRDNFPNVVFPHLKNFETMTWNEILQAKHGKDGKSNSHFVPVSKLLKEARDRFDRMQISDVDEIFSLRLKGETRIYGLRYGNVLDILWVDNHNEIYPDPKD